METEGRRESDNVEDKRGISGTQLAVGGGIGSVVVVVVMLLLGVDPGAMFQGGGQQAPQGGPVQESPEEKQLRKFVAVVLADTEDVWKVQFPRAFGKPYELPKLTLFRERINTGCGAADAGIGPFYCSKDDSVYIDLNFMTKLQKKLGATGDFATAYIIAHEVGHHVQKLTGVLDKVHAMRNQKDYLEWDVRLELQADFYAGVWAHYMKQKNYLQTGDLEEAQNAARRVGDDYLQEKFEGQVRPEKFTHGRSEWRKFWFDRGFKTGDPRQGDTMRLSYKQIEENRGGD